MSTEKGSLPLRVPFDSLTLAAVAAELRPLLIGGQIQDIRQPEPNELLLTIRSQGRNFTLLLSADARFARMHLTTERKPNSPTPSAFCIALRRHLENGRILDVRQRDFDRVFEIDVQLATEDGTLATPTLVAELMGKHSNLILVSEHGIVVEAAKRISSRINRFRETLPGKPYLSPPVPEGRQDPIGSPARTLEFLSDLPLTGQTVETLAKALQANIAGMSPFLALEIAFRTFHSGPPENETLVATWGNTVAPVLHGNNRPCLLLQGASRGAYPIKVQHLEVEQIAGDEGLNSYLDTAFRAQVENAARETAIHDLTSRLGRETTKLEKQVHDLERTISEGGRADDYQQQGDLLTAHLWKMETGATQTTVQDFYSLEQTERIIVLDPKLNPQENARAYFRRAQKARDAKVRAQTHVASVRMRLNGVAAAVKQMESDVKSLNFTAADALAQLRKLIADGVLREERSEPRAQPTGPDFQGHKIRRYTTPEGYEIYCGETATANDFLTTRVASPNDLWLHVRASPGSHVVIRTKGQPDKIPQSVLHRAALIAALHSNQKHSGLVPVDYTLKKYVRKPRGAAPGSVEVQREKTLHVSPQEDAESS
jgi:predicted ribosome quality control (RQC) complex YloA/Tae2 family protein